VLHIAPSEGISWRFEVRRPGPVVEKKPVTFAAICRGVVAAQLATEAPLPDLPGAAGSSHTSGCRLLRVTFSPKTSRTIPRRSVLLASGLGISPTTLDLHVICISGVPIAGSPLPLPHQRGTSPSGIVNSWDLPDDHEVAPVALPDRVRKRRAEMAVAQAVDDDLADLFRPASRSCGPQVLSVDGWIGFSASNSAFMSLMVVEKARPRRCALAVERQNVVAGGRPVAEDKDLAPAFGAQADEVVAGAAQEAGEIEGMRFEPSARVTALDFDLTIYILLKKGGQVHLLARSRCSGATRCSSPSFSSRMRMATGETKKRPAKGLQNRSKASSSVKPIEA
jgi:hypothetical protein